jgi:hypothetical protein
MGRNRQRVPSMRGRRRRSRCVTRRLAFERLEPRRVLAVLMVTGVGDVLDAEDGFVSLREAILAANNDTATELGDVGNGADEIRFAESLTASGPVEIKLELGELEVSESLRISGPGAGLLTVDAQQRDYRVLHITATGGDFALSGLTLAGGRTFGFQDSNTPTHYGGAIRSLSAGTLTIDACVIRDSSSTHLGELEGTALGGGIYGEGSLTVLNSTVRNNRARGSEAAGGGIWNDGPITIENSTINTNTVLGSQGSGGGVLANGELSITNSTVSGNRVNSFSGVGGGLYSLGDVTLSYSTVVANFANTSAGGLASIETSIAIRNSIVAANTSELGNRDLSTDSSSLTVLYSLIGDNSDTSLEPTPVGMPDGNGNLIGTAEAPIDPLVSPLADNGGPTSTHALLPGSPAVDSGMPDIVAGQDGVPAYDQRGPGFPRIAGPRVDMGAFEVEVAEGHDPVVTPTETQTVNEGTQLDLVALATFTDVDEVDTHSATINWGDDTPSEDGAVDDELYRVGGSHTYADNGSYTVTVAVSDSGGGSASASFLVVVNNVPPSLLLSGPSEVDEGSLYTLSLESSDLGADTISSWAIHWGDDTTQQVAGNPSSVTHVYADGDATYNISATATDEDGTFEAGNSLSVTVHNVAPSLLLSGPAEVNEGSLYTLSFDSSDPGADAISSWTIHWGDGTTQQVAGHPSSVTHVYEDGDATYNISATATDEEGTYEAGNSVSVTTQNVLPSLVIASSAANGNERLVSLVGTIRDPAAETFGFYIDWGDGTTTTGTATNLESGEGPNPPRASFNVSHEYATADIYTIVVRVADDDISGDFAEGVDGVDFVERATSVELANADDDDTTDFVFVPFDDAKGEEATRRQVLADSDLPASDAPSLLLTLRPPSTAVQQSHAGASGSERKEGLLTLVAPPVLRAIRDDQVVRAAYYQPSMVDRNEVIDAAFALGDLEMVRLVGVDMGDEPVFARKRKAEPEEVEVPVDAVPAVPIAELPVPEVPVGPSWTSLAFWAALAGSGTLWASGTWWWVRRGKKMSQS